MSGISRTYIFGDGIKFAPSQLENELANFSNTWNNHNAGNMAWDNVVMKAPDGRLFRVFVGYLNDGITPTLAFQEVTYP